MITIPPPLAEHARTAQEPGTCAQCPRGVSRGERVAQLPNGDWAHVACIASLSDSKPPARPA